MNRQVQECVGDKLDLGRRYIFIFYCVGHKAFFLILAVGLVVVLLDGHIQGDIMEIKAHFLRERRIRQGMLMIGSRLSLQSLKRRSIRSLMSLRLITLFFRESGAYHKLILENKVVDMEPYKSQEPPMDKTAKLKYKKDLFENQSSDEIAQEMPSDSKPHNMKNFIKQPYKPFEYKDKSKVSLIKLKNGNDAKISSYNYLQGNIKKINKSNSRILDDIYDKPLNKTNYTSNVSDQNRSSYERKIKEQLKTQNERNLQRLLLSH